MQNPIENLEKAKKIIQTADHMIYMTFPLIKDKKLLIKSLIEIKKCLMLCINSVLQQEYNFKRITIYQDPNLNFQTFKNKCAKYYSITQEELKKIDEIFEISKSYEQSTMEFIREEKLIIMPEKMNPTIIPIEKIKELLITSKQILLKVSKKIFEKF